MAQPQFTDAIALLKADHRTVEGLFAQCRRADVDLFELRDRLFARKKKLQALVQLPLARPTAVRLMAARSNPVRPGRMAGADRVRAPLVRSQPEPATGRVG